MEVATYNQAMQLSVKIQKDILEGNYDSKTLEALRDIIGHADGVFLESLKDMLGTNSLHKKDSYDSAVKSLEEGSIIVYFKSAKRFKVYKKDDIDKSLLEHLHTLSKYSNMFYEIIPNNSKQKIVIFADLLVEQHLDKIRQYIITFMQESEDIKIKPENIVFFKNLEDNTIEIIFNNHYVENSAKRHMVISSLLEYISLKEGENRLTRKMGFSTISAFKNASMTLIPLSSSQKQIIETPSNHIKFSDFLVTNVKNCALVGKNIGKIPSTIRVTPVYPNQYVYLLRPREFLSQSENTYKIGKTLRPFIDRLKEYKSCELFACIKVSDANILEKSLIQAFDDNFENRRDIGREYYRGDINKMLVVFFQTVFKK